MDFGIASVAAITVIAYLVGMAAKDVTIVEDKWIPVIVGVTGLLRGVAGVFVLPDFPAYVVFYAAARGGVSGLAATGINQIGKQLQK